MVRRLTIAFEVVPGHTLEAVDRLGHTGLQRACNGRLLSTACPPKGPLHSGVKANRAIALGDGLSATQDPQQGIEDLLNGTIADALLGKLHLFPQGGKEAVPFEILTQGTQAGTA